MVAWIAVVIIVFFFIIFTVIGIYFKFVHYPLTGAKRIELETDGPDWIMACIFFIMLFVFLYAALDLTAAVGIVAVLSPILLIPLWWQLIKWLFKP